MDDTKTKSGWLSRLMGAKSVVRSKPKYEIRRTTFGDGKLVYNVYKKAPDGYGYFWNDSARSLEEAKEAIKQQEVKDLAKTIISTEVIWVDDTTV